MRYRELEHTADLAIEAYGRDLAELFENAAHGLFDIMMGSVERAEAVQRRIRLENSNREGLLVDWLNELIYLRESEGKSFERFQVSFPSPGRLEAEVWGAKARARRPVKAATFHGLAIEERDGELAARVVFDV